MASITSAARAARLAIIRELLTPCRATGASARADYLQHHHADHPAVAGRSREALRLEIGRSL